MRPKQFVAPTAREALKMVRESIGPNAVILQNRSVPQGVAVTAIDERDLEQMQNLTQEPVEARAEEVPEASAVAKNTVPDIADSADEAMSTVRFQRFANERRARGLDQREQQENEQTPKVDQSAAAEPIRVADNPAPRGEFPAAVNSIAGLEPKIESEHKPSASSDGANAESGLFRRDEKQTSLEMQTMVNEMRMMRSFISQQFSALAWVDGVRRSPAQARLLRTMLAAGFSGHLSRAIISKLPDDLSDGQADQWLRNSLSRNLRTACWDRDMLDGGGVYALVGPTGVGKTTSAAKIAARFALQHGAQNVGLVSVDAYRVSGQDQLRQYGRMIGAAVHTAHDSQSLADVLEALQDKALVLIDTAGLGQRDPRVAQLLDGVSQGAVQRLVVVSAAAQAEALQETLDAYGADEGAGVLLTKTDEACRLGGALDQLIRLRLPLLAVGNGQRVPEDWAEPQADDLIRQALLDGDRAEQKMPDIDLTMLMQRVEPMTSFNEFTEDGNV